MTTEIVTAESLNPRGRVVQEIEMAVRRSRAVGQLCRLALEACGSPRWARLRDPWGLDYTVPRPPLITAFGEPVYEARRPYAPHWAWFLDGRYDGTLERHEQAALANLPEKVREKLHVTLDAQA